MNRILYPDGTWAAFTYEGNGNVLTRTRETGFVQSYTYDSLDRIIRIQGREVRLSYNPLRQLEELEDWLGTTRIENDALGRAVKVSYPEGETVSYSYGKAGERTSLTYPDGRTVTYGYDELIRLTELRDGERSIRYAYDAQGRLEEKRFPGGMTSRYAYDDQGRIESLTHSDREGILDAYTYKYDILGNKTAIEKQRRGLREESGSYAYGYDALGRLSSVTKDGTPLRSYAYDAFGNRTGLREREREIRYTYNALNQLVSLTDGEMTEEYAYDKRGNLTEHLRNGTLFNRYMYGALNRLEKAVNGEGVEASYQYNGLGYRTGKSVRESLPDPEKQVRYTIDLTRQYHNLLQKEEEGESLSFLWDGGAAGMRRTTAGGTETEGMRPETQEYYLQDDLGSPIRLLSESGEVTESYGYDEFGRDLYGNQGEMQPFGYTGYQYDRVSDTYFAQVREYMPGVGRFAGQDIIKGKVDFPLSINSYIYCVNAPINYIDEDGLWPKIPNWGKIAIGIGAIAVGAAVTVATGGAALPAVIAGVKTAATVGMVSAATSAGITATKSIISGEDVKTGIQKTVQAAVDGFSDGFMWGGIMFGASASYAAFKSGSSGIHFGSTAKPQYGRLSLGYGNAGKHTHTIFSLQNAMGKSRFRVDVDLVNYLHIHFGLTNRALRIHRKGVIESIIGMFIGINDVKDELKSCEND